MSVIEIRLAAFTDVQDPTDDTQRENVLVTGNIQRVIQHIDSTFPGEDESSTANKITALLFAMCEARQSQERLAPFCDGGLTTHFQNIILKSTIRTSIIALRTLKRLGLPSIRLFSDEVKFLDYYAKPRFVNGRSLLSTRFSHHLSQNLGNLPQMSKAAAFFTLGSSLLINGTITLLNPSPAEEINTKNAQGAVQIITGTTFTLAPVIDAFRKSAGGPQ